MNRFTHPSLSPVEVRLGNESHSILLTHGSICLAEKKLGIKILEDEAFWDKIHGQRTGGILDNGSIERRPPGLDAIEAMATLLYAGLLHEEKPLSLDQLIIAFDTLNAPIIGEALGEAIRLHLFPVESPLPQPEKREEENPTTAVVTG